MAQIVQVDGKIVGENMEENGERILVFLHSGNLRCLSLWWKVNRTGWHAWCPDCPAAGPRWVFKPSLATGSRQHAARSWVKGPAGVVGKRVWGRLELMLEDTQDGRAPQPHHCHWLPWNPSAVQESQSQSATQEQLVPWPLCCHGHPGNWGCWSLPCFHLQLWVDLCKATSQATNASSGHHDVILWWYLL